MNKIEIGTPSPNSTNSTPSPRKLRSNSDSRSWSFIEDTPFSFIHDFILKISGTKIPQKPEERQAAKSPMPSSSILSSTPPRTPSAPISIPDAAQREQRTEAYKTAKKLEDHLTKFNSQNDYLYGTFFETADGFLEIIKEQEKELGHPVLDHETLSQLTSLNELQEQKLELSTAKSTADGIMAYCSSARTADDLNRGKTMLLAAETLHKTLLKKYKNNDLAEPIEKLKSSLNTLERSLDFASAKEITRRISVHCSTPGTPDVLEKGKTLLREAETFHEILMKKYKYKDLGEPIERLTSSLNTLERSLYLIEAKKLTRKINACCLANEIKKGKRLLRQANTLHTTLLEKYKNTDLAQPIEKLNSHLITQRKNRDISLADSLILRIDTYCAAADSDNAQHGAQLLDEAQKLNELLIKKHNVNPLKQPIERLNFHLQKQSDVRATEEMRSRVLYYCANYRTLENREAIGKGLLKEGYALNKHMSDRYNNNTLENPIEDLVNAVKSLFK